MTASPARKTHGHPSARATTALTESSSSASMFLEITPAPSCMTTSSLATSYLYVEHIREATSTHPSTHQAGVERDAIFINFSGTTRHRHIVATRDAFKRRIDKPATPSPTLHCQRSSSMWSSSTIIVNHPLPLRPHRWASLAFSGSSTARRTSATTASPR